MNYRNGNRVAMNRRIDLINRFRKLWLNHVVWTRSFMVGTEVGSGDLVHIYDRLIIGALDFAKDLATYYGLDMASEFKKLFTENIEIVKSYIEAVDQNDDDGVEASRKKSSDNIEELSILLTKLNPYWNGKIWTTLLTQYMQITEEEIILYFSKNYEGEIQLFDELERHILEIADYMANAIARQFEI